MSTAPPTSPQMAPRPCPLRARADLVAHPGGCQGESYWLVKDPVSLEYHRLHPAQYAILQLLDGSRSLEQIQSAYLRSFPTQRISLHDLELLLGDFHAQGLVVSDSPGQAAVLHTRGWKSRLRKLQQTAGNLLYIKLPGWDPERTLARLEPATRWLFSPVGVACGLTGVLAAWALLLVNLAQFDREMPTMEQFFGWPNLAWLWLTLGVAKILHELGHGLACRRMGGECHEIGMAFLMFSPCLYCDVSDSWMLSQRWRRIAVACAGMYVELLISALGILVWSCTQPGLVHFLALQTFIVTTFTTVMLNANPLLQFDGYYILGDLLDVPNLRAKSDRLLAQFVGRIGFGLEWPADPFMPQHGRFWFALYAGASVIYRCTLMFSVSFVLYEMLRPVGLQSLALLTAVAVVFQTVSNSVRLFSAPRVRPMHAPRALATGFLATAIVAGAVWIPIPYRLELPFVVDAHDVRQIYASTSGRLVRVAVQPGQHVEAGDLLFEFSNHQQEDHLQRLRTSLKVEQIEESVHRRLNDAAGLETSAQRVAQLTAEIAEYEQHLSRLKVVAPCGGTVIAPRDRRPPPHDGADPYAPQWSGTPLETRNVGVWIETGSHLASIAPDDHRAARVIIEQAQRDDVPLGCQVELKCESAPGATQAGSLTAISLRDLDAVPDELSNKYGGAVPTVTATDGRQKLISHAFEGLVEIPDSAPGLLPGMQGRARLTIGHRTAAQWLYRWSLSTLHFRI
ncbi:MAG: biotin/lipoyl-binding protein [Planctomycetes bacterium]|nr:biotin/lipoyl-binding protein [Planctomycetota bacterium]